MLNINSAIVAESSGPAYGLAKMSLLSLMQTLEKGFLLKSEMQGRMMKAHL